MTRSTAGREKTARRLMGRLDIPEEAFTGAARITVSGDSRVLIEGHRGLVEYAEDRIAAAGKGCRIIIKGEGLAIETMSGQELVVTGRLWAVEFE